MKGEKCVELVFARFVASRTMSFERRATADRAYSSFSGGFNFINFTGEPREELALAHDFSERGMSGGLYSGPPRARAAGM